MTTRQLLAWGDREERRRRASRRGPAAWSPWLWSAAITAVAFAEVMRRCGMFGDDAAAGATPTGASRLWLAGVIASHSIAMFGAPFRMFWRHDAALLARLPIPGAALYQVAQIRSLRAAALVALPCAGAALGFAAAGEVVGSVRHVAILVVAALGAGVLAPAATLAAGAIIASDRARAMIDSLGGEFHAPPTAWLGLLPGVAAAAIVLLVIAMAGWAVGDAATAIGRADVVIAVSVAGIAVAGVLAWRAAGRVMTAAVREVSALDRERLAHLELHPPTLVERAIGARLDRAAALVHGKDCRLLRRRYPMPYLLGAIAVIALWIVAAAAPIDSLTWTLAICSGLGVYAVVMSRRTVASPTEYPAFLQTLPIAPRSAARAKLVFVATWLLVHLLLGGVPTIVRADAPPIVAGSIAAIALAALIAAARSVSR